MEITRIKLARVGGYASEDTGNIIKDKHPSIILQLEDNIEMIFPFTSDSNYAIKDKFGIPDAKFYNTEKIYANTRIKTFEEYTEAKNYYLEKGDYKTANNIHIGTKCYHPIENHNSYLEKNIPIFRNETGIKVTKMEYYSKFPRNELMENEIKRNKEFFSKGLKSIEYAMILGKVNKYESSSMPIDYPFENQVSKFKLSERVDIAYAVNDKRRNIDGLERISKIEYVEKLRHMQCFNSVEKLQLLKIETNLKIEAVEFKQEKIIEKHINAHEIKKEIVIKGDLEAYKKIKIKIENLIQDYKNKTIEKEELKERIKDIDDKLDNPEKLDSLEKIENNDKSE